MNPRRAHRRDDAPDPAPSLQAVRGASRTQRLHLVPSTRRHHRRRRKIRIYSVILLLAVLVAVAFALLLSRLG
jgi:hypothetical protein